MNDQIITDDDRLELIEDAAALIFPFYVDAHLLNTVKQHLVKYSSDLLCTLVQCFRDEKSHADNIKTSVAKGLSEGKVREHIAFFPLMEGYSHRFRSSMVESLRTYSRLPNTTDLTAAGPEVISQCKALIRAALTIEDTRSFNHESCAHGIIDPRLVDLIISHADAPEQLLNVISERRTADPFLIREILHSESPAISEGTL